MATIYKTIGVGGDYETVEAWYAFLVGLGAWTNDYETDLISSLTITAWPSSASRVNQNGHSLKLTCSFNEANKTRPDLWYTISFSGTNGKLTYIHDTGADLLNDIVDFEYIGFEHLTNTAVTLIMIRCWVSTEGTTWSIKNCWFKGSGGANGSFIRTLNNSDYYDIENIVFYDAYRGLRLLPGVYGVSDNFPGRKKVKNITGRAIVGGRGLDLNNCPGNNITFENVYLFGTNLGDDWIQTINGAGLSDRMQIKNCADSDNSINVNMVISVTTTDCVPNVVAADELQSVDLSDLGSGFMELKTGEWLDGYIPGSTALGQSGIDSGLTSDIYGQAIPGVDSYYSIGAFQQQYIMPPLSELDVGDIIDVSSGDVSVISEAYPVAIEALANVSADPNFSLSSKWKEVIVTYEHNSGQKKRFVHKLRWSDWIAYGDFVTFCNGGFFRKLEIVLIDNASDILVIGRDEIESDEDVLIYNGSDSSISSASSESSESSNSSESYSSELSESSESSELSESS